MESRSPEASGVGRKTHETQERHGLAADLRLAYAGLIWPLLAAAHLFRQPAFDKWSAHGDYHDFPSSFVKIRHLA
jgi:hypothetical protein